VAAAIGDDGHRFPIVSCEHSFNHTMASGVKAITVADAEFLHLGMRAHLLQETKPFDNPVVQVDEFSLTQPVNDDLGHLPPFKREKSRLATSWRESSHEWTVDEDRFRQHIHLDTRCLE